MRTRYIRPEFFENDDLGDMDPLVRLLFIGLWCLADRRGILRDKPRRIKAKVQPYDNLNIDEALDLLADHDHLVRYADSAGDRLIQIPNLPRYQKFHPAERPNWTFEDRHGVLAADDPKFSKFAPEDAPRMTKVISGDNLGGTPKDNQGDPNGIPMVNQGDNQGGTQQTSYSDSYSNSDLCVCGIEVGEGTGGAPSDHSPEHTHTGKKQEDQETPATPGEISFARSCLKKHGKSFSDVGLPAKPTRGQVDDVLARYRDPPDQSKKANVSQAKRNAYAANQRQTLAGIFAADGIDKAHAFIQAQPGEDRDFLRAHLTRLTQTRGSEA